MTATMSSLGALAMPNVDASTARRGRCDVADRMRALGITDYVPSESTQSEVDDAYMSEVDTHVLKGPVTGLDQLITDGETAAAQDVFAAARASGDVDVYHWYKDRIETTMLC